MIDNEALNGNNAYLLTTMLKDLRIGLWAELEKRESIDAFRRNLQRAHVQSLEKLMKEDMDQRSDVSAAARAELRAIQFAARKYASKYKEDIVRFHLQDIAAMIEEMLETGIKKDKTTKS